MAKRWNGGKHRIQQHPLDNGSITRFSDLELRDACAKPKCKCDSLGYFYNFRFDSNRPPQDTTAVIGFFKTGAPITVPIQAPQLPHD